ncbi:MAG: mechanosensitive ion channel family protein [Acidobacteriota bacterium]
METNQPECARRESPKLADSAAGLPASGAAPSVPGRRYGTLPDMDWLGIDLGSFDLQAWAQALWELGLPRLASSGALLLAAAVVFWILRLLLDRVCIPLSKRTASEVDDCLFRLVRSAVSISTVFFVLWRLTYIWHIGATAKVVVAAWLVLFALPLSRFVAEILTLLEQNLAPRTATTFDDTALPLVSKVIRGLVVALASILALDQLGINITPLVAGASVAGFAITFAAKDTLSNFIAGVLLILDRPFRVGDRIELWSAPAETATWGDVIEVGLRATKIRTTDNLIIVIPNNEIMRRDIVNYTASGDDIRVRIPIDIAYDADASLAKRLIREVADSTDGVMKTPAPQVIIRRFGESGVSLQLRVWIGNARKRRAIADEITDRVKQTFDQNGIEIPYPKRDLYIKSMPGLAGLAGVDATDRDPATSRQEKNHQ